jgi:hypothetical protein
MTGAIRVVLEVGPKGKRVVAVAPDWPGLERGAKTEEAALERLADYLPRYAPVAKRTRWTAEFERQTSIEVVERYEGNTSTDFWGISWVSCNLDRQPIPREAWERRLALLRACWAEFDAVAARVSPELRAGPRGGGRNREEIINHVFGNERTQFSRRVGVETPPGVMLTADGLKAHRDAFIDGLRAYHAEGRRVGRTWTISYLLRHAAYHVMDHAWEMEDRDLTGQGA